MARASAIDEAHTLSVSLEDHIDPLRALLSGGRGIRARHAVGATVAAIKARPELYGSGAVARLAMAIGEDVPSLYRFATVAECWSVEELERVLEPPGGSDGVERPLSWSHLVVIASLASRDERAWWIEEARRRALSVRQLEVQLAGVPAGDALREEQRTRAQLARAVRAAERFLDARLEDDCLSRLRLHRSSASRRLFDRAVAIHAELTTLAARQYDALRERATASPMETTSGRRRRVARLP